MIDDIKSVVLKKIGVLVSICLHFDSFSEFLEIFDPCSKTKSMILQSKTLLQK